MAACNGTSVCSVFLTLFSIACFFLGLAIVAIPATIIGFPEALNAFPIIRMDFVNCLILIVAGGLLVLSAIFGCVIGCKRPFCLIITFCVLIVVSIGLQVAIVIMIKDPIKIVAHSYDFDPVVDFRDRIKDYWSDENKDDKLSIDYRQEFFECCGYDSYLDWKNATSNVDRMGKEKAVQGYLPRSCCVIESMCEKIPEDIMSTPCKEVMVSKTLYMTAVNQAFVTGAPASLLFQLTGLIMAIVLAVLVRREKGDDRGQFIPMSNQTSL